MPVFKKSVIVRETETGYDITVRYGPNVIANWSMTSDTSMQDFLFRNLGLRPGDRVDLDIVSEDVPMARIGRPRPKHSPRTPTGRATADGQEEGEALGPLN